VASVSIILLMTVLLDSPSFANVTGQTPDGAELIGTKAPGWEIGVWLNTKPLHLEDLRGKVVLVRWWTDTCPYCYRSAPSLNEFHTRYEDRGLMVIGIYHPKPLGRPITTSEVREAADERGFDFAIGIDRDWSVLQRWWLDGEPRSATSVSFLIDRRGVIRHVHSGPAYHREVVNGDEGPRRDFFELDRTIEKLLADPSEH
jgi:thiol-disulfide isomerase/thioredoxin